ncbi:methionyl-tRNA formyltransferase [Thiospirillum jenense]|uniref:Methionyl-tRNA formyltransferase n=1 Tax=Thiospirillum jenense TaxID=1653858 RepID=A0A839H6Q6_9GAMM|nr:methionyl-tRNA formyltransferase [Thiospirillum jenense]MBB1125413.1 methionyl-tRNA formyltransferase [Thiospirillum jenense]
MPRLLFAGTPAYAVPTLIALVNAGYSIAAVYTQPDRPAGRGQKLQISPVKEYAASIELPIEQPLNFKDPAAVAQLNQYAADLMIVIAYGLLLPPAVLTAPRLGCINLHASLLPRWRGAAPIQRAILAGDNATGVDLMQMDAGLDTGPLLARQVVEIPPDATAGSLHDQLAAVSADLLIRHLPAVLAGQCVATPQPAAGALYAKKLTKAEAQLDWQQPAAVLDRHIRALNPWPVAQTRLGGDTLRIWAAQPLPAPAADAATNAVTPSPGQVIATSAAGITVATGDGHLLITQLQPPGKRVLTAAEFLNARNLTGVTLD